MAVCFLCGCTKKEELLILTEEAAEETAADNGSEGDGPGGASSSPQEDAATADLDGPAVARREETAEASAKEQPVTGGLTYVHVCGAVKVPGVYELPAGSRVYEAVQAAGGFAGDADQNYVNQAEILTDGVKLVIPTVEEAAQDAAAETGEAADAGKAAGEKNGKSLQIGIVGGKDTAGGDAAGQSDAGTAKQAGGRININTATKQELCAIPGVGETRAAAIISYRESHGGFAKPEDIMKVSGIKEGMYDKIKDSISVE